MVQDKIPHPTPTKRSTTREFYQEGNTVSGYSLFDFLHGYLYARWPYLYIGVATGEHPLTKAFLPVFNLLSSVFLHPRSEGSETGGEAFADTYHGKVVPLEEAEKLVSVKEDLTVENLESVIPYHQAKAIILKNPDRIAVLDCPCRSSRENPCAPLDVCLIIGEPFVSFILEHHPQKSRLISSEEAVQILQEEHQRGHVSHAFFKDAMLDRFYAICNCCACCCGAFQAHRSGTPMLASSGYLSRINREICAGCGDCAASCQFFAITVIEGTAVVDEQECFGCGVCVDQCPEGAIELVRAPARGTPLEIEVLRSSRLAGDLG